MSCLLDNVQKIVFSFFLPFTLHTTGSDMIEILQPFKVAHCHTTSIAKNVGKEENTFIDQNLFSFKGSGAVSSLDDEFGLEFISIANIDSFFKGSRDEKIAFFIDS